MPIGLYRLAVAPNPSRGRRYTAGNYAGGAPTAVEAVIVERCEGGQRTPRRCALNPCAALSVRQLDDDATFVDDLEHLQPQPRLPGDGACATWQRGC